MAKDNVPIEGPLNSEQGIFFYRHVNECFMKDGGVHPSAFASGYDAARPGDGCSVDVNTLSSSWKTRVVLGLMRKRAKGAPEGTLTGDYKDPSKFLLFKVDAEALQQVVDEQGAKAVKEIVSDPSNPNPPYANGRPKNLAHCLIRPTSQRGIMALWKAAVAVEPCPVIVGLDRLREYTSRHQAPSY